MKDERTLKQLARESLDVQCACNLSGVVHGMSQAITRLRELFPNEGTEFFNTHPIMQLWASKIHDLARMGLSDIDRYGDADKAVSRIAE